MRFSFIIILSLFLHISRLKGQSEKLFSPTDSTHLEYKAPSIHLKQILLSSASMPKRPRISGPLRPQTFHPAFFCRLEDRAAENSPLLLKMRLGSVDYVDYLESKPHSALWQLPQK